MRGVIFGMSLVGRSLNEIAQEITKSDGAMPSKQGVADSVKMVWANGGLQWDGVSESAAGRPRKTTAVLDRRLLQLVTKHRGSSKVTVDFVRRKLPASRVVSKRTLQRRLNEAGLAWLRRRRKTLVAAEHKRARIAWAKWVLTRTTKTLARWAFTDGTVFYLARGAVEALSSNRAALGPYVWRQTDGSDALYEDCVGPSQYWKAQGCPVRIWGLLLAGALFIYVLPEGEVMNRWWYEWIIAHKFPVWIRKAYGVKKPVFLVQDHERCLWTQEPRQAMQEASITLLQNYPKCSQDLNPIENAWREVRFRMAETQPRRLECRDEFIKRLRLAVAWVNRNRQQFLQHICTCQKEWATDVLNASPAGARTPH